LAVAKIHVKKSGGQTRKTTITHKMMRPIANMATY
jgi:hypothetical protein